MSQISVSRVIDASPERVWAVLTDLDHAAETLTGVTSVQLMTDGPYAVGTRWRETRRMFGRSATEEMWVSECDPLRRTKVRAESHGAVYVTEFTLTPLADGPRAEFSDSARTAPSNDPRTGSAHSAHTAPSNDPRTGSAHSAHTELTVRFETDVDKPLPVQRVALKLFANLAERATRKALEQNLADIAAAAETTQP